MIYLASLNTGPAISTTLSRTFSPSFPLSHPAVCVAFFSRNLSKSVPLSPLISLFLYSVTFNETQSSPVSYRTFLHFRNKRLPFFFKVSFFSLFQVFPTFRTQWVFWGFFGGLFCVTCIHIFQHLSVSRLKVPIKFNSIQS